MRYLFAGVLFVMAALPASAAQQLGDVRMNPVLTNCPAGMILNRATGACIAEAPNGCCAPNPQRAVCLNALPGQPRWSGHPADIHSQAVVCPR